MLRSFIVEKADDWRWNRLLQ